MYVAKLNKCELTLNNTNSNNDNQYNLFYWNTVPYIWEA